MSDTARADSWLAGPQAVSDTEEPADGGDCSRSAPGGEVSAPWDQLEEASGDQPLRLLEQSPRVEAVAGAADDQRRSADGPGGEGEVERLLRLDRRGEIGEIPEVTDER